jgi:predicted RNA-binding protein YlqC (UPF0109 family)
VQRLVEAFARALVLDGGAVRVSRVVEEDAVVYEVDVSPDDRGRLIGRKGQTISALRTILDAVAEKRGEDLCELEIVE